MNAQLSPRLPRSTVQMSVFTQHVNNRAEKAEKAG